MCVKHLKCAIHFKTGHTYTFVLADNKTLKISWKKKKEKEKDP